VHVDTIFKTRDLYNFYLYNMILLLSTFAASYFLSDDFFVTVFLISTTHAAFYRTMIVSYILTSYPPPRTAGLLSVILYCCNNIRQQGENSTRTRRQHNAIIYSIFVVILKHNIGIYEYIHFLYSRNIFKIKNGIQINWLTIHIRMIIVNNIVPNYRIQFFSQDRCSTCSPLQVPLEMVPNKTQKYILSIGRIKKHEVKTKTRRY